MSTPVLVAPRMPRGRSAVVTLVAAAGVLSVLLLLRGWTPAETSGGLHALRRILAGALRPEVSPSYLVTVLGDAVLTLSYAVAAMTLATAAGLAGALLASGRLFPGLWLQASTRVVLAVLRAPHELIWALLFVYAVGLSPSAGILAIAVPYAGTIGRVLGDALQDVNPAPVRALESIGASRAATLLYGIAPQVAADGVGYLAYRFECALRTAAVLSFVGLGGLGHRIELALLDLDYARAWTPIYATLLLVLVVDRLGAGYRRSFAR